MHMVLHTCKVTHKALEGLFYDDPARMLREPLRRSPESFGQHDRCESDLINIIGQSEARDKSKVLKYLSKQWNGKSVVTEIKTTQSQAITTLTPFSSIAFTVNSATLLSVTMK
jgi:hypothetical protein